MQAYVSGHRRFHSLHWHPAQDSSSAAILPVHFESQTQFNLNAHAISTSCVQVVAAPEVSETGISSSQAAAETASEDDLHTAVSESKPR